MTMRPTFLLRLAGVFACVAFTVFYAADLYWSRQEVISSGMLQLAQSRAPRPWFDALSLVGPCAVAALFWLNTKEPDGRPRRRPLVLLGLQSAIAFALCFNLLPTIALEAGLLFPNWLGLAWILAQAVFTFALGVISPPLRASVLGVPGPVALPYFLIVGLLECLFLHFVTYACGAMGATERRQGRALAAKNAELEALNQRLLAMQAAGRESARLGERLLIARELHDALGHHLTALSLSLQLADRLCQGRARPYVSEAYQLVRALLSDVRAVVQDLRDARHTDLLAALRSVTVPLGPPTVHLEMADFTPDLEPHIAHALYRCAQESVTNARKHSGAQNVWLSLRPEAEGLEFRAQDDGCGSASVRLGHGLRGMSERVEGSGGVLEITSAPGKGFGLRIWIPLSSPQEVRLHV